jgi:hypothetical protein
MDPGRDCLECHSAGGDAPAWTAAGTWTRGARVTVTDANGRALGMRGNQAGNFYTAEPLAAPFTASVDGRDMPATALVTADWPSGTMRYGGCNLCHQGAAVIDLAFMARGRDCLGCHEGATAVRFTAAGTWIGSNVAVRLVDAGGAVVNLTTNAAGNFWTSAPLVPPFREATVGGSSMDPPPTYGGCNACHGDGEADD